MSLLYTFIKNKTNEKIMEEFKVRKLNKDDIGLIVPLRVALQVFDYGKRNICVDEESLAKATKEYLINNLDSKLFMFGGFIGEELVSLCGYNIIEFFPTHENNSGKEANICSVITKEEYRGKGYMTKLFQVCLEHINKNGFKSCRLVASNPIALKIYEKFGFVKYKNIYKKS